MKPAATHGPRAPLRPRDERDALVERWLPLVRHVVARLPFAPPRSLDRDDLVSAGTVGLLHAAATWDPERGAAFQTFAYTAIRGAVLDEVRRADPLPRGRRRRLRMIDAAAAGLGNELGRAPTVEELAERIGMPVDQLDADLLCRETARTLSLAEAGDGEEPLDPIDPAAGEPPDRIAREDLVERLAAAIGDLPERERDVVALYHLEGLYLKEIAALLEVTESRVCQILARATSRLRWIMNRAET